MSWELTRRQALQQALLLIFAAGVCCNVRVAFAEETAEFEMPAAKRELQPAAKMATQDSLAVQAAAKPQLVKLADGKLLLPVPGDWKSIKPRSRILQHEFSIAASQGDKQPGRMTIMAAGGGVEANIARWVGQFRTAEGKPLSSKDAKQGAKKIEKKKIDGLEIHLVDLAGDYQDSPRGPFGPKVNRPGYRMLAAIIPLGSRATKDGARRKGGGTWFIKLYGPQATVKAAEKSFAAMIEGVKYAK